MSQTKSVKPANAKKTIFRLLSYYKYNKGLFILGLVSIVLSSLAEIAANGMLSPIIDVFVNQEGLDKALRLMMIMACFVVILAAGQYLGNRLMATLAQKIIHQIRTELFNHMQQLPISFFDQTSHGELMSSYTNDVDMLNQSLEQSVSQIIVSLITVVGTFTMMLIISPFLTLMVALMLGVMFIIVSFVGGKSSQYFRKQQLNLANMNGYIEEMMSGQKVVKVFNFEERAIVEFEEKNEQLRQSSSLAATFGVMLMPIMGNLTFMLYSVIAMLGSFLVINNTLTIGNIAAYLQYTRTVSRPITMVSNQLNMIFAALAGAERIFNLLDQPIEDDLGVVTYETENTETGQPMWRLPIGSHHVEYVPVEGGITFDHVYFGYTPDKDVLKDISLFAKPGQKISFVGSTGAGKTTIINLINRFYEITKGSIYYDGIDIRKIKKEDLRATMSIVLQDVHLFEGTIRENIRYGRLDATDEEIVEAAKLANAHYFIKHLPEGYETHLTPDGLNLSQGERQLLSIARAAIANPRILILDEATSSVDTRTEKLISQGMDKLMEGRTTFVIAHRLSTIRDSHAIMVMEQGRIIERGNHQDLMALKGRYYELNVGKKELD